MIKSIVASTLLLVGSAHALIVNVAYPEGVPEADYITCIDNITSKETPEHNMNSQDTHKYSGSIENALEVWGTIYLKNKTARLKPVPDGDMSHNFVEFQLADSSNVCRITRVFKYKSVNIDLFLDGHCVITGVR